LIILILMATTYPATKAALQAGRLPAQARPIESYTNPKK
jgi:hypothetical protein